MRKSGGVFIVAAVCGLFRDSSCGTVKVFYRPAGKTDIMKGEGFYEKWGTKIW